MYSSCLDWTSSQALWGASYRERIVFSDNPSSRLFVRLFRWRVNFDFAKVLLAAPALLVSGIVIQIDRILSDKYLSQLIYCAISEDPLLTCGRQCVQSVVSKYTVQSIWNDFEYGGKYQLSLVSHERFGDEVGLAQAWFTAVFQDGVQKISLDRKSRTVQQ